MTMTTEKFTETMTAETFNEAMEKVDAIHQVLEDLTPPEALEILVMVSKNLKAEIRDFRDMDYR